MILVICAVMIQNALTLISKLDDIMIAVLDHNFKQNANTSKDDLLCRASQDTRRER